MAYLKTNEAVRARKAQMDSNAEQFARSGNPWHGEFRLPAKSAKPAKPKPAPVRAYTLPRSEADEAFLDAQCALSMRARIKAYYVERQRLAEPIQPAANRVWVGKPQPADPKAAERRAAAAAADAARRDAEIEARRAAQFTRFAAAMAEAMGD